MTFNIMLRSVAIITLGLIAAPVAAQQAAPPPVSATPVPDQLELSKLIWSTMAAVDHANISGNYSVLRDMSAPSFQASNDPAKLAQIFVGLRQSRIDLSNTMLLAPTFTEAPTVNNGLLRTRGYFGLRPTMINFDLYYQWINNDWRLFGVTIQQRSIGTMQPDNAPPSVRSR